MILIQAPPTYEEERKYVLNVILDEFLGIEFGFETAERENTVLSAGDDRRLVIADGLFATPGEEWLREGSLPSRPVRYVEAASLGPDVKLVSDRLPVIYGRSTGRTGPLRHSGRSLELDLDIFGSVFFMLTRYEEAVLPGRDGHGRFPASASLAGAEGFLDRPVVNEYVEVLWSCMKRLWPSLKRKPRSFRVIPTHDVDCPAYYEFYPTNQILMGMAGDVLKRRSLRTAVRRFKDWREVISGRARDPFDTFSWLMDLSESSGWKSTFNFISGGGTEYDRPRYPLDHRIVRGLIDSIGERGHEIGFHPSYATMADGNLWKNELEALRKAVQGATIRGGRQHYLRFEIPTTWRFWEEAGLEYDSTMTYADAAGFRCGTCYEFPVYDLKNRSSMRLRERPTVVMESTVISDRYMGLGTGDKARALIKKLKGRCRAFDGDFVLLWHNSALTGPEYMDLCRFATE
jgi:hypothetical protein